MIPSGIRRAYEGLDNGQLMSEMKRHSNINSEAFQYLQALMIGRLLLAVENMLEVFEYGGKGPEDGEVSSGKPVRKRAPAKSTGPEKGDSQSQG